MTAYHMGKPAKTPEVPTWAQALITIEDDVPVPLSRAANGKSEIYDKVQTMKVGQSFAVPYHRSGKGVGVLKAGNLARATGYKFTQRTFVHPDTGVTMLRIWRTG